MNFYNSINKKFWIGSIFLFFSILYTSLQLSSILGIYGCIQCTYLSLLVIPYSLALILMGTYKNSLEERRKISDEELQTLFSEGKRYSKNSKKTNAIIEVERLSNKKTVILELDALPLRIALVDIYPDIELVSKARYDLKLLEEYTVVVDDEELFEERSDIIEELIRDINEEVNAKNKNETYEKLRAELKTLKEQIAQYEKAWAEGEMIFKRVMYWAASTAIIFTLVGILPILHPLGNNLISIGHWGALGIAGALLSVLVAIRDPDIPELGETHGKLVLQQTILGIVIGCLASVLLYSALSGGILAGNIFPNIPIQPSSVNFWSNTGNSIFWGLAAGFSLRIFAGLIGIAESAIIKKENT